MSIPSNKRALVALAALLCATAAVAGVYFHGLPKQQHRVGASSVPDIVRQLPSNASVLFFIDVASWRKPNPSPLARIWGPGNTYPNPSDSEYSDFLRDTGFDYARDLDRVAVAFWPTVRGASARSPVVERFVAIAAGRFDQKKIDLYARRSGKAVAQGSRTIYQFPGKSPVSMAFLSATQIAFASEAGLISSLSPAVQDENADALIRRVATAPFFAIVHAGGLPENLDQSLRGLPQIEQLLHSLHGLALAGQPDGENVRIVLDGEWDSAPSATQAASLLEVSRWGASLWLAKSKARNQMSPKQAELLQTVLAQLNIVHQDDWVRISLGVTPAMLESAWKAAGGPPEEGGRGAGH